MKFMLTDRKLHPRAKPIADDFKKGDISRREYLALMTGFGVSAAGALAIGGLAPSPARAEEPKRGGTLRVAMNVKGFKDPRTFVGQSGHDAGDDFIVRYCAPRDAPLARFACRDVIDDRIRNARSTATFVSIPSRTGLLAVAAHFVEAIGNRRLRPFCP